MKVLLYSEGMKWIQKSGLGRAIKHQQQALELAKVPFTTNEKGDFDLVHINTYFLKSRIFVKKWKKKGIPVVYHAHSTEEDFRNSFLFSNQVAPLFRRWIVHCYNLGDVIITPTFYAKQLLEQAGVTKPIYPVSNGIDLRYYQSTPVMREEFREMYQYKKTDKVVMAVGLYIKRKGILDFVELAKRMPEVHFIWFGALNLKQVPKEIRQAVRTELPNLRFAGYVSPAELRKAYAGADLFFFPTYEETEGIVLMEAMAMEQNILVRDIPIYAEYEHGTELYKGANLFDFEKQIKGILDGTLPSLKQAARKKVSERDIHKIGEQLKEVYQAAIKLGMSPTASKTQKANK